MDLILLIFTLLSFIAYPILLFKIIKAIWKKDQQKLRKPSIWLVALILIPGFYWGVLPGSDFVMYPIDKIQERSYNFDITGHRFNDGKLIYDYKTERAFNGDGYSIWIHEIDENTANYFKNPNDDFFSKHPRTDVRSHWKPEFWKRTPVEEKEQKFVDFAYISLDELDFELEDLLNEEGNYYGYEYYLHDYGDDDPSVGDIDFYIICPKRKIIVKINHNT